MTTKIIKDMTGEDMQLVAKALCGYLPYGLKFRQTDESTITLKGLCVEGNIITVNPKMQYGFNLVNEYGDLEYKPYLRPMSSMTKEELKEFVSFTGQSMCRFICEATNTDHWFNNYEEEDWLDEHHFDYRCLIEKGLALPAPEGMYDN